MGNKDTILNFHEVYFQFHKKINRYLERLTGDNEEAKDLTQDVFIKVNKNLAKFEGKSSLSTWIYRIATNTANDRFRSSSFQKVRKQTVTDEFIEENKVDQDVWSGKKEALADEQLTGKEMSDCINRYIYDLNENYRTVLIMSEYEGMKNKEIAEILGLTIDTVKIRIHRGRTQLKKRMDKGCEITPDSLRGLFCNEK